MFEEAQLYSPVTTGDDGAVTVHLADDHPGVNDPAYRERRNAIAAAALDWEPGEPVPRIDYTEAEQEVWRTVWRELAPKHERYACRAFREAVGGARPADATGSPSSTRSPPGCEPLTGFEYVPAAGIVPLDEFYGSLADRRVPLDPVRPPPRRAALHARARPDPRGDRPRPPARRPAVRRAQPARRRGRAPRRDRGGPAARRRRLLVHDRVRRRPRGRRAARLRRRDPLLLRRDRGVPRHGDPPARLPRRWRRSTTTSPTTSRSCSAPTRWTTWSTRSAAFFAELRRRHAGAPRARPQRRRLVDKRAEAR